MVLLQKFKERLVLSVCVLSFGFVILVYPAPSQAGGQNVVVWSYYNFPPFITLENQGLSHDLIKLLNESGRGKFKFYLCLLPRKRIDLLLADNKTAIVLFVNPAWMGLPELPKYQWTSSLFSDRNVIVSNVFNKVEYTGPESLAGLTMGGIAGRKYQTLEELVDAGIIKRENTTNEKSSLLMLSEKRIDFTTGPETMLQPLAVQLNIDHLVYFSPTPLFQYTRHILISNAPPKLSKFLMQFVSELPTNLKWIALKSKYQLRD